MLLTSITKCSTWQHGTACSIGFPVGSIDDYTRAFLSSKLPERDAVEYRAAVESLAEKLKVTSKQVGLVVLGKRNFSTVVAASLAAQFGLSHIEMLLLGAKLFTGEQFELIDPKTDELLKMAKGVLTSGDQMHAAALESNIISFWHAVQAARNIAAMAQRIELLEAKIKECPTCDDPPESSSAETM
jgi:hypothetical protein